MMRIMSRSSSPAQFYPKLLGGFLVAVVMATVLLHMSPSRAVTQSTHKSIMGREEKRPKAVAPPRPQEWGKLMRREAAPVAPAMGAEAEAATPSATRVLFLVIFGAVAIAGFAGQAK